MMDETKAVWDGDKLDRRASATYLTAYLNALFAEEEVEAEIYKSSYVLNINAGWGYGKTFFIKKWAEELRANSQPVVYFDAWCNDFAEDPLLAFIADLEDGLKPYFKNVPKGPQILEDVVKAGKNVLKPIMKVAANMAVSTASGGVVTDVTSGLQDNVVDNAIKSYRDKRAAIKTFKEKLDSLVKALKNNTTSTLPIYIFIDELDRCRPTYAVSLLEAIKHIFGVSGLYFIIATNKTELSHSVKAIYGSEFDALTYLRRFFDQEYVLPKPDNEKFAVYLMDRFRIASDHRLFTPIQAKEDSMNPIAITFALLANGLEVSLRDQVQVAMQLKSIILTSEYRVIHVMYLIFIMMLRQIREQALHSFFVKSESVAEYNNFQRKDITFYGTIANRDSFGSKPAKIKIADVIELYRTKADINAIKLFEMDIQAGTLGNIKSKLQEESPRSYTSGQHYPLTIASYQELVHQAGQLII